MGSLVLCACKTARCVTLGRTSVGGERRLLVSEGKFVLRSLTSNSLCKKVPGTRITD